MFNKKPEEEPPTGIDLDEMQPTGRGPIPRLLYVAVVMLAIVFVAILAGMVHRASKAKEGERAKVTEELASEPASSSRQAIEAQQPTVSNVSTAVPLQSASEVYANSQHGVSPFSPLPVTNAPLSHPELAYQPGGTTAGDETTAYTQQQPQLTPLEQAQQAAELKAMQAEEAARTAPTTVKLNGDSGPATNPVAAPSSDAAELAALLRPTGSDGESREMGLRREPPTSQQQKITFASDKKTAEETDDYLHASRTDPASRFELQQGTRIPAITDEKALSDIPGEITAVVRHDVMDTLTGKYVLIPAGSRLIGEYNSTVSYGQNRLQIVWTRILFPDTTFLDLGRMNSHAADGASGLHDKTDAHWARTIAGVALTSLLSAGFQLSQNRSGSGSVLNYPSTGQVIAGAVGQQASQLGQELTQRNLNAQPSIKIRAGEKFFVFVKRDISFDAPYDARL